MSAMLQVPAGDVPHAVPDALSAPFWAGCAAGELRYQRCTDCGTAAFPPTAVCRRCLSSSLVWNVSAGRGSLYSWTVVWRPVTPAFPAPYAPAIVELAESFQMVSNLVDCAVEELRIDMPLTVVFCRAGELALPYVTPLRDPDPSPVHHPQR